MEWSFFSFLIVVIILTLGALVQASTGMGAGFVVIPFLALMNLDWVPGPPVCASLVLTVAMSIRGRKHIDYGHLGILNAGLLVGVIAAASLLPIIPLKKLGLLFGILILFTVLITGFASKFFITHKKLFLAGSLSGFIGTSVGIGAPILALAYQHQRGDSLRATLAFLYMTSSIMMLVALVVMGRFGLSHLISAILMIPGYLIGYALSPRLVRYVDAKALRPMILVLSASSALILIFQSLK